MTRSVDKHSLAIDLDQLEGVAANIDVGIVDPASLTSGHPVLEEEDTDWELDADHGDAASSLSKPRHDEVENESPLEVLLAFFECLNAGKFGFFVAFTHATSSSGIQAVDNVGVVMSNLLKVQTKCESLAVKLSEKNTDDAKRRLDLSLFHDSYAKLCAIVFSMFV